VDFHRPDLTAARRRAARSGVGSLQRSAFVGVIGRDRAVGARAPLHLDDPIGERLDRRQGDGEHDHRRDELEAVITVLSWWADTTTFKSGATLVTSIIGDNIPENFIKDRIAFMKHDFSKAA
jgi:hypothetical protein